MPRRLFFFFSAKGKMQQHFLIVWSYVALLRGGKEGGENNSLSRFVCILQCSFYNDAPVYLFIIQERERGSNEGKPPGQWHRDREPTSGSRDGKSQQTFSLLQGAQTARRRRRKRRRRSVIPLLLVFQPSFVSIETAADPPPLPHTHTHTKTDENGNLNSIICRYP